MNRSAIPFYANDSSALARSLHGQLTSCDHMPGHVELLNMLARAVGSRNFQHLRAKVVRSPEIASPVDQNELRRLSRYFDATGRLLRWPKKFSHQEPCLWVVWTKLPPRKTLSEREVNEVLLANHAFEDPAL